MIRGNGGHMKKLEAEMQIRATPAAVWAILTDTKTLATAGLGIIALSGDMRLGGRLRLVNEVVPGRTFSLHITTFDPSRRMVWRDGLPLGLFTGVRSFTLTATPQGTTFVMTEVFTGLLLPLIWRSMPDLDPSFQKFAAGLKLHAERQ